MTDFTLRPWREADAAPSPGTRTMQRSPPTCGTCFPAPMPHRMRPRLWRAASGRRAGVRCAGPLRCTAKLRAASACSWAAMYTGGAQSWATGWESPSGAAHDRRLWKPMCREALQPGTSSASTLRHLPGMRPPAGCWRRRGSPWRHSAAERVQNGEMLDSCIYALVREEAP